MVVVDSHCHVSPVWFEPVESLLFQMDRNEVEHAVLVQMMGQFDNAYQQECARRYAGRFASVVLVDWQAPSALEALRRLADQGASGVRLRPDSRSPGRDPLAIWRTAEELALPVSCIGKPNTLSSRDCEEVVTAFPRLTIVIEHMAGLQPAEPDYDAVVAQRTLALARYPNVFVKIQGLGEFARRAHLVSEPFPFEKPIPPLLDQVYGAFGPHRMMWGSDYPPVSRREGYANALRFT